MQDRSGFRRAEPDEAERLADLLRRAYTRHLKAGYNFTAATVTADQVRRRIEEHEVWVLDVDGSIVGTITFVPSDASIHNLAVEPDRQGRGFGIRLLQFAERRAVELGYSEVQLDTPETLDELVGFYRSRGYRVTDTVRWGGKRYRLVIFVKSLSPSS
jgi:ribosomal protein S18 acetylase RimI-like enzyme